jgi:hypothetical protein
MATPDFRGDLDRFLLTASFSSSFCPRAANCEAGGFSNLVGKKYQLKGNSLQSDSLVYGKAAFGLFRNW